MLTRNQEIGANIQARCTAKEASQRAIEGTCLRCAMRDVHNILDCGSCPAWKLYEMNQNRLPSLGDQRPTVTVQVTVEG